MTDQPHYPYSDGDFAVLGPEVFASADGLTISWQGSVYHRHPGDAHYHLAPAGLQEQIVAILDDYPVACWTPGSIASRIMPVIAAAFDEYRAAVHDETTDPQAAFNTSLGPGIITDPPGSHRHRLTALGRRALTGIDGVIAWLPGQACTCGGVWPAGHRDARRHEPVDHDTGPTVAECAAVDRNWDVQQEGE